MDKLQARSRERRRLNDLRWLTEPASIHTWIGVRYVGRLRLCRLQHGLSFIPTMYRLRRPRAGILSRRSCPTPRAAWKVGRDQPAICESWPNITLKGEARPMPTLEGGSPRSGRSTSIRPWARPDRPGRGAMAAIRRSPQFHGNSIGRFARPAMLVGGSTLPDGPPVLWRYCRSALAGQLTIGGSRGLSRRAGERCPTTALKTGNFMASDVTARETLCQKQGCGIQTATSWSSDPSASGKSRIEMQDLSGITCSYPTFRQGSHDVAVPVSKPRIPACAGCRPASEWDARLHTLKGARASSGYWSTPLQ